MSAQVERRCDLRRRVTGHGIFLVRMNIQLTALEARVIGSLIEKAITTPDQYPLSLNALTNACNQKSNRDPVLELDERTVQETLDALAKKHLVLERSGFGSRVPKYQHRFCNTGFGTLEFTAAGDRDPVRAAAARAADAGRAAQPRQPHGADHAKSAKSKRRSGGWPRARTDRSWCVSPASRAGASPATHTCSAARSRARRKESNSSRRKHRPRAPRADTPSLQERVAQLEQQVAQLQREIEELRKVNSL